MSDNLEIQDCQNQIALLQEQLGQIGQIAALALQKADMIAEGMLRLIDGIEKGERIDMTKWVAVATEFEMINKIINHRGVVSHGT